MPRYPVSLRWLILMAAFFISCATGGIRPGIDSLSGDWVNEKGITVRIHRLADSRLGAEIISAPGFFTNDVGGGSVVLRDIRPYTNGYAADFVMPGNERPVRVQIRFLNYNTLIFQSADKRIQGNRMIWKRAPKDGAAPKT
ncbi:MAG: hypothetical protein ACYC9O_17380 [Candidatus Latescibacterota bacterium]